MGKLDWKSQEDYEFTSSLTNTGWAWEFLRRSSQYRQDWIDANTQQEQFSKHQGDNHFSIHRNPFVIFEPALPEGVHPDEWSLKDNVEFFSPLMGYGHKWGLKGQIQDPAIPTPPRFEQIASAKLLNWEETNDYFFPVAEDVDVFVQNGKLAVVGIDLTRSLTNIQADIRALVKSEFEKRELDKLEQRDFKKKANWPVFLRIIDARTAGVQQAKIAKTLLGDKLVEHEANTAISRYINNDIPRFSNPEELLRLANEPG